MPRPNFEARYATLSEPVKATLPNSTRPAHAGSKVVGSASIVKPDGRARYIELYDDDTDETVDEKGNPADWDLE